MAETIETEELEGLCREICREMVPNWDIGAGPRPGPGATARNTQRQSKDERRSGEGRGATERAGDNDRERESANGKREEVRETLARAGR